MRRLLLASLLVRAVGDTHSLLQLHHALAKVVLHLFSGQGRHECQGDVEGERLWLGHGPRFAEYALKLIASCVRDGADSARWAITLPSASKRIVLAKSWWPHHRRKPGHVKGCCP